MEDMGIQNALQGIVQGVKVFRSSIVKKADVCPLKGEVYLREEVADVVSTNRNV